MKQYRALVPARHSFAKAPGAQPYRECDIPEQKVLRIRQTYTCEREWGFCHSSELLWRTEAASGEQAQPDGSGLRPVRSPRQGNKAI